MTMQTEVAHMYFGSHVSIREGYLGAAKMAVSLGGTAYQYFPKNPRSLSVKSFDAKDAEACARFCEQNGLLSISHGPYPTNLAVDEGSLRKATIDSLVNDLHITDACGSIGLIVHFGKYKGKDPLQGYKNILQCLNEALRNYEGTSFLLLENQAGVEGNMGTTLEELVQIRSLAERPEKIGFCLDTCHAFASGLWAGDDWSLLIDKGQKLGYFDHLKAVHLNDSVYPSGSGRDRHANVGKGHIGEKGMREVLQSPFMRHIPIILETPQFANYTHREEIAYLRSLVSSGENDDD
jgi:deoxyribonuclease-4